MNIEEIRKNAPDGATHYRVRENSKIMYYIFERGELSIMRKNNKFTISAFNIDADEIKPLN
jgi:hypothetical protein